MEGYPTPPAPPPPPAAPGPPAPDDYPVRFSVDYPDRPLNRLTTAFRVFVAIPIVIVLAGLGSYSAGWGNDAAYAGSVGGGLVVLPTLLMILFRRKYPRWWFDWNLEFQRFTNRVFAYLLLMEDRYPSTDEQQYVHLDFPYPDAERDLNRWLPLVKWLLAIPHVIVLIFLWIAAAVLVVIAWFAILLTGTYPRSMFEFVEGVMRWTNRVEAYAVVLVTDRYPPFRLNP
jgi:uncharacterized protein DUF4389